MALLNLTDITYAYDGSYDNVFEHLTCQLDTSWRLGLIGRNGRGKTTLLRILQGELHPSGQVSVPCPTRLFPTPINDPSLPTIEIMRLCAPDTPDWRLLCESSLLCVPDEALERPFHTLSRGEQTKAQLAALFAREDAYPLIDEPTNHLDLRGRELVGEYISRKDGYLLVSHDRAFLNRCVDHVLSLNRSTVSVQRGNFDTWERELERKNQSERDRNDTLKKDIKRLEESARRQAEWSRNAEKAKFHVAESVSAVADRGYLGARSAAMMKRSLSTQARRQRDIDEKSQLLKDVEKVGELKLTPLAHPKKRLIEVTDGRVRYGERTVCENIRFTLEQGERVALAGINGAGKSSVLQTLCGRSDALTGDVRVAGGLIFSYLPQDTSGLCGELRDFIAESGADETLFKAILRNMDFGRQQFDKNIGQYSEGQKKKLLLARSLCDRAHVYVWDEPLNYIDVLSRMQLETLILEAQPTMLLVEHDRAFLERVCTRVVTLGA